MTDESQIFVYTGVLDRLAAVPPRPWEVGGWLLGYWSDDGSQALVTHATPPTRGTPFFVRLSGRGHRRRFDEAWSSTGGEVTFLGDWHTHPGGRASPSERDEAAVRQLADDPDYGTSQPVMAIVATARWPWQRVAAGSAFFTAGGARSCEAKTIPVASLPSSVDRVPDWPWPNRNRRDPTTKGRKQR